MSDISPAFLDYLVQRNEVMQQLLADAKSWKLTRYFHDCLPGCKPDSPDPHDHVPLKPDQGPTCRTLYRKARRWIQAGTKYPERGFIAANRIGKALEHGTPIATPNGWRAIETLLPGDIVVAGDGSLTRVIGVYPQGEKRLLRFTFDVGETITCCEDHLWLYQHPRARYPYRQSHGKREPNPFYGEWAVASASAIREAVGDAPITRMRAVVPTSEPWQFDPRPVPLDPYLLGVLLGDGGLTQQTKFTTGDYEIVAAVEMALPDGARLTHYPSDAPMDWTIAGAVARNNPVRSALQQLGLAGCGSQTKRVPPVYLLNSPAVRLAVLQGLMDTDGSITASGAMEFSSVSPGLAEDVMFLVHSLGGKCASSLRQTHYTYRGERRAGAPSTRLKIRLNVCPFRLSRKARRWHHRRNTTDRVIHRIEDAGVGPCTCIAVDHPSHTYVTAHGIVTHNTDTAAYEVTCHLTGRYPPWWDGKRWDRPTDWRAAGDTMLTTRDILQKALLGPHEGVPVKQWAGMIQPRYVLDVTRRSGGITNCIDTIHVRHVSGGISRLSFLSYDMGRRVFQGFDCDGFWIDEEPPDASEKQEANAAGSGDIYGECLLRTMTTDGIVIATFTPLRGWTQFMRSYFATAMMPGTEEDNEHEDVPAKTAVTSTLEGAAAEADEEAFAVKSDKVVVSQEENPYAVVQPRFIIGATWDDAPHLTDKVKAQQWASMLPYQRAARTKGIPQLGAGAVYPIDENELRVPDFAIPEHWWRGFAMDVGGGAKPTAAVFCALNPEDRVLYVTSVYKRASNEPSLHAAAIKERMLRPTGWIWPGVGDAAALILTEHDAEQLVYLYRRLGLPLYLPDKAVETGISDLWDLMVTGKFHVFASCQAWFDEFRMYRRDARGRVVKSNDHLMDSTRYMARSGIQKMKRKPPKGSENDPHKVIPFDRDAVNLGWMGG